jgi:hypothetical protein
LGLGNILGGALDFCGMACQPHLCYQLKPFYPSINQSPASGQTNQGSLFEPRNTSPPWKKNHKKYFKDFWGIGADYRRIDFILSIQCKN